MLYLGDGFKHLSYYINTIVMSVCLCVCLCVCMSGFIFRTKKAFDMRSSQKVEQFQGEGFLKKNLEIRTLFRTQLSEKGKKRSVFSELFLLKRGVFEER